MKLDDSVLVLNRLWQAVNVVTVRRALTLLFVGRGRVVDQDFQTYEWQGWSSSSHRQEARGHRVLRGVSCTVAVPRVLLVNEYDKVPRPRVRFTRSNVYLRDGHRCQYCGALGHASELTLDHVVPRSRGGTTTWKNIVVSCARCNARKGNRRPEEAGMPLLNEPGQPRWHPAAVIQPEAHATPEWQPFLAGQRQVGASSEGSA